MNEVVNELCSFFKNGEIRTVLQKGQGIASLYECPLMRECGDIDLYFPDRKEREKADLIIRQQGIQTGKGADGSIHYEWKGVVAEHHSRLLDVYSPFQQDYLNQLEKKIGYQFRDKSLLKQALTHSSFANEQRINKLKDYERLEFLGDSVLCWS